jgi:hypothetical protein
MIAIERKPPANTNALARMRLDALHGLAMPVQWVDPLAGYAMSVRYLRLARTQGEPHGLACALAEHAFARSLESADAGEIYALLAQARELAGDNPPPELEVELAFREGSVATSMWNLPLARERLEHAQRLGTERCPDQPWLLTHVRTNLGSVLANMGEHAVLADLSTAWLAEARDRNDEFARATLEGLGYGFYRHLMLDKPDRASQRIEEALSPWPAEPYSFAHLGRLIAHALIEQYRGGEHLLRWLDSENERMSRSLLFRSGAALSVLRMIRCSALLAAHSVATEQRAQDIRKQVRQIARQLRSSPLAISEVAQLSIELQLAALERDQVRVNECGVQLGLLPGAAGNQLHELGIRVAEGCLAGGAAREHALRSACHVLAEQGWREPTKAIAMLWPGLGQL